MALIVGGAVALAAAWWAGRTLYARTIIAHRDTLRAVQADITALDAEKRRMKNARDDWKKIVARTLDYAPERAHMRFREDMSSLLERHGFTNAQLTVRSLAPRRNKDGTVELPVQITTRGKLKALVSLMVDIARREYLLRVESLSITAEQGRSAADPGAAAAGRRGRTAPAAQPAGDPNGPDLSIAITASTLAVPKLENIVAQPLGEIVASEQGRLPRPPAEYDQIVAANVFSDYKAPPPPEQPTAPVVADGAPVTQPPVEAPRPAVNPRADAAHLALVGSTGTRGELRALVRDDRNPTDPADSYPLNSTLDDGVLVLVHPRGIVVHSTAGPDAGREFFYKLGTKFTERVLVANVVLPDVRRELDEALGRTQ